MQEQDHSFEEEHQPASQVSWAEGIHSFQEVIYPPPRWKRVLFAVLQFVLGVVIGLALVGIVFIRGGSLQSFFMLLVLLFISIPCMRFHKTCFFGLGLLTCILTLPFIITISYTPPMHPSYFH
jgi:hypothetical protein